MPLTKQERDQIISLLDQVTEGGDNAIPGSSILLGPGLVEMKGIRVLVDEPIASDWEPTMNLRTFASQGRHGYEPSNAGESGQPKRSPGGYPLHYAIGGDGMPTGTGKVTFGESTFDDEAQMRANTEAAKLLRANALQWEREHAGDVFTGLSGVKATEVTERDAAFLMHLQQNASHRLAVRGRSADVVERLLTGTIVEVNRVKQLGFYSNLRHEMLRDPSAYIANPGEVGAKLIAAYNQWIAEEETH